MKKIVYTVLIGDYDKLGVPGYVPPDWETYCITDSKQTCVGWNYITLSEEHKLPDAARTSRKPKILSHAFFPDADVTLYIDANMQIVCDINKILALMPGGVDIANLKHPTRCDVMTESEVIIRKNKDDATVVNSQIKQYIKDGYPVKDQLACNAIILRKHTDKVKELNELWWQEICNGSKRDQLSFPYAVWKLGITWMRIEKGHTELLSFKYRKHGTSSLY